WFQCKQTRLQLRIVEGVFLLNNRFTLRELADMDMKGVQIECFGDIKIVKHVFFPGFAINWPVVVVQRDQRDTARGELPEQVLKKQRLARSAGSVYTDDKRRFTHVVPHN